MMIGYTVARFARTDMTLSKIFGSFQNDVAVPSRFMHMDRGESIHQ